MNSPAVDAESVIRATDYLTGDTFTLVPTPAGWWSITPVPSDLTRYYPPIYYGQQRRRFPSPVEWLQDWLYWRRVKWMMRIAGNVGRVLDVGCGPGNLLARFRVMGWETVGTEATEGSAMIPRERHGLDVRAGELRALQFASESFDVVVSWHTLEHMRDPGEVLDECARLLRPDGVLFVSVPDFSSPEARANPPAWFHLDVPRHVVQFPAAVLRAQLAGRGFHIEEESFWAPEYDAFSLTQTWQNRLGLPHNTLYVVMKGGRGLEVPMPTMALRVGAVMLALAMLPAAAVVTAWRAWRKTGAVVVILARKSGVSVTG